MDPFHAQRDNEPLTPSAREESSRWVKQLASIVAVQSDIMGADVDADSVMQLVAVKAQRLTQADGSVIEMRQGNDLVYTAATGNLSQALGIRIPLGGSLSGLCVSTGEVLTCSDTETDPRAHRETCRRLRIRSMVVVPLSHERNVVGVLKVAAGEPNAFTSHHTELLRLMAGLIAAAISRAGHLKEQKRLLEEREQTARLVEERSSALRAFYSSAPFPMGLVQREGDEFRLISVNEATARLYGKTPHQIEGKLTRELSSTVDPEILARYSEAELARGPIRFEAKRMVDGQERWLSYTVCPLDMPFAQQARFSFIGEDITERRRAQKLLEHQVAAQKNAEKALSEKANELRALSLTDELTGLYNRRGFTTLAEQQLKNARRSKSRLLILYIDLDGMKQINDRGGHEQGDEALKATAAILKAAFRDSDIAARLGGDEFAVLASNASGESLAMLMERIQQGVDRFNESGQRPFQLSLSIGAAEYDPQHPELLANLLVRADNSMYLHKKSRR